MKILNTINGSIKKFGKGMIAIFAIKLLLFGGAFIIQSCQTESIEDTQSIEQELALSKFESLVRTSTPKIQSMVERQQSFSTSKSTFSREVQQQNEAEMIESLNPLVEGTKELLLAFEIEAKDLEEVFGNENDPRLVIAGLALLSMGNEDNNQTAINFSNIFVQSTYAQSGIGNCVLEALGVNAAVDAFKGGIKKLGKKGAFKLLKKVAGRALGPIGVALAIIDFADCMGAFN